METLSFEINKGQNATRKVYVPTEQKLSIRNHSKIPSQIKGLIFRVELADGTTKEYSLEKYKDAFFQFKNIKTRIVWFEYSSVEKDCTIELLLDNPVTNHL